MRFTGTWAWDFALVKNILVVDDNEDFGSFFKSKFSQLGEIRLAFDYASAVRSLEEVAWDLMVLDYTISQQETCFDLIPIAKQRSPRAHIIIVTGNADKEMAIRAVNAGVSGFLEKPFPEEHLMRRLHEIGWFQMQFILDHLNRQLCVGTAVYSLTSVEYRLLNILVNRKNSLVTRQDMENEIWSGRAVAKNALDTHLYNLKKKIPELKHVLASIHGTGYMLRI